MKYIKKFNESVQSQDLKEFCDNYLAYLLDDGFEIRTVNVPGISVIILRLSHKDRSFLYGEVEEHFIPFLHMLNNNYKIGRGIESNISRSNNELTEMLQEEPIEFDFVEEDAIDLSVKDVLENESDIFAENVLSDSDLSCIDIKVLI